MTSPTTTTYAVEVECRQAAISAVWIAAHRALSLDVARAVARGLRATGTHGPIRVRDELTGRIVAETGGRS